MFEDPKNKAGGDYKLRLAGGQGFASSEQSTLDFLNVIWEQLVQDLITHRFPHHQEILGVRMVDKSFSNKEMYRFEVWVSFGVDQGEAANAIRQFIELEYNQKHQLGQGVQFGNHAC